MQVWNAGAALGARGFDLIAVHPPHARLSALRC